MKRQHLPVRGKFELPIPSSEMQSSELAIQRTDARQRLVKSHDEESLDEQKVRGMLRFLTVTKFVAQRRHCQGNQFI